MANIVKKKKWLLNIINLQLNRWRGINSPLNTSTRVNVKGQPSKRQPPLTSETVLQNVRVLFHIPHQLVFIAHARKLDPNGIVSWYLRSVCQRKNFARIKTSGVMCDIIITWFLIGDFFFSSNTHNPCAISLKLC